MEQWGSQKNFQELLVRNLSLFLSDTGMEGRTSDELVEVEGGMRKWEDLNRDCLANIIERVGMESLVSSFPYVCKNWYNASLDPQCWKSLDFKSVVDWKSRGSFFRRDEVWLQKLPLLELVNFAVGRSQGIATTVVLTDIRIEEAITYISNTCPMLKTLILPLSTTVGEGCISKLIRKWTYLEHLTLTCEMHFDDIISEINTHCKNFASLTVWGYITYQGATTTIVTKLPNIRCLSMAGSDLALPDLVQILSECKKLEFLDVSGCIGFNSDDAERLEMASHIETFLTLGSDDYSVYDYTDEDS